MTFNKQIDPAAPNQPRASFGRKLALLMLVALFFLALIFIKHRGPSREEAASEGLARGIRPTRLGQQPTVGAHYTPVALATSQSKSPVLEPESSGIPTDSSPPSLFKNFDAAAAPPLPTPLKTWGTIRHPPRRRIVQVDTEVAGPNMERLLRSKPGDRILLQLFPEVTEIVQFERIDSMMDGSMQIWHGVILGKPGSRVSLCRDSDGRMDGRIANLSATYELHNITANFYEVSEMRDVGLMDVDTDQSDQSAQSRPPTSRPNPTN